MRKGDSLTFLRSVTGGFVFCWSTSSSLSELLDSELSLLSSALLFAGVGLGGAGFCFSGLFGFDGFCSSKLTRFSNLRVLSFSCKCFSRLCSGAKVICSRFGLCKSGFSPRSLLLCFRMLFVLSSLIFGGSLVSLFCACPLLSTSALLLKFCL